MENPSPKFATIDNWIVMSGMGRRSVYDYLGTGELKAVKVGARTLIDVEAGARVVAVPAACGDPRTSRAAEGRRLVDAARLADQSWPDANIQFRRPWSPPQKRKRQGLATPAPSQHFEISSDPGYSPADDVAQRAIDFAMRRAARIDRTADLLLSVGRVDAAERLSRVAADLREVAE